MTLANRMATANDGRRFPDLIREMKGRDTPTRSASCASVTPFEVIHCSSVITLMCHMGTIEARGIVPETRYTLWAKGFSVRLMSRTGHFIKEWRKHRGLTQDQLAERIGINRAYLSKIESGKRRYDQPFLEAAADVLRCDPADLIVRDPADPDGIWSIWDQLKPAQRNQVVEIAKTIRRTGTDG